MPKRFLVAACLAAVLVAAFSLAGPWRARQSGPSRTVEMSMRDYSFNGQNPTLTFEPGERIRFVVTNDETTRVLHNFRIVGMDVPCGPPLKPGERREIVVSIPKSGEFAYTCCTHPGMGGKLVVAGR